MRQEHRRTMRSTGSEDGGGLSELKRKRTESSISGGRKKMKGNWRGYPSCDGCRRYRYGGCGPRPCRQYGRWDHVRKDCPQPTSKSRNTVDAEATAKIAALTEAETKDNKIQNSGKLFLGNFLHTTMLVRVGSFSWTWEVIGDEDLVKNQMETCCRK